MMLIAQLRKPHTHYSCNSQSLAPLVQTLVVIIFVSSIGYRLLCGNRTRCLLINLGKGSKTPGTETFRWGGTPPRPRGLHGRDFPEKLAEISY